MSTKIKRRGIEALPFLEKLLGPLRLSDLLKSIRVSDEISQVDFAKKLGISRSHLNDIEKGRKMVGPGRAKKFAKILGLSEKSFIQLALQEIMDRDKLNYKITLEDAS